MVFQLNYHHVLYVIPGHRAERLKPTSGGRGFLNQFLPDQKSRKPLHAQAPVPMVSSGTAQARESSAAQSPTKRTRTFWGEQVRTTAPCLLLNFSCRALGSSHPFKTPEVAQRVWDAAPAQPCWSASGNTCLGDAELHTSEQKHAFLPVSY